LQTNVEVVDSPSALRSVDVAEFLHAQRRRSQGMEFEQLQLVSLMRLEFLLNGRWEGVTRFDAGPHVHTLSTATPAPRAWIVHDVVTLPELQARHGDAIWHRSNEVLDRVRPSSFAQRAIIESDTGVPAVAPADSFALLENCQITHYAPERVEIASTLHAAGLLVLADAYDPNWRCWSDSAPDGSLVEIPVVRTNRILRGVWLPAGEHRLEFRYRPWSFFLGAAVSALGWYSLAMASVWFALFARKNQSAR
jgi:hypothetical protein